MKVLEVGLDIFEERPGGVSRYFAELMAAGPAAGLELRGLAVGHERHSSDQIRTFAAPEQSLLWRMLAARSAIGRELRDFRPTLLASHFAQHVWPALGSISVPSVVHFHGPWALESAAERSPRPGQAVKKWIESQVYRRADLCLVLSEAFREVLVSRYGVEHERVLVVSGGVDCGRYDIELDRSQAREQLGWPKDRPIVLSVRRLVHRMGLETAIAAVAKLVHKVPDLLLIVGGSGPLAGDLARQVDELGLTRNVRLVGRVSDADLPVAYRAANLTLVPTLALEGFGLIAVESLAAGTPVLATPVGGLPEVVLPLSPSLVLGGTDAEAIAAGIEGVVLGRVRIPSGPDCIRYARENYDWSLVAGRIAAAYRSVL